MPLELSAKQVLGTRGRRDLVTSHSRHTTAVVSVLVNEKDRGKPDSRDDRRQTKAERFHPRHESASHRVRGVRGYWTCVKDARRNAEHYRSTINGGRWLMESGRIVGPKRRFGAMRSRHLSCQELRN
jgi:hypothetical protein